MFTNGFKTKNTSDLNLVDYAVLESNGQISVIRKSDEDPLTSKNLNLLHFLRKAIPKS